MKSILIAVFWVSWGLIFYAYCVFPFLLAVLARCRPVADSSDVGVVADTELPRVAMLVAAYNEEAVLGEKLANTWRLDYPPSRFEILIGSDGSSDATNKCLRSCTDPRLRAFVFALRRGKISVLNDLVAETDADIIVMSDANTKFDSDAIRKMVGHFRDPRIGCVSGQLFLEQNGGVSGEGFYWKYESWIKRNESRLGFLIGCNGGIFALRRRLYTMLPPTTIVEDFVLSMRVLQQGFRVRYEAAARATEPPCSSARAEMVRKIRIGAGGWQALSLTGSLLNPLCGLRAFAFWGHKVLRWSVPMLFLVSLCAALMLWDSPIYRALFGIQFGGIIFSAIAAQPNWGRVLPSFTRPLSYFYLMNYALLCGFFRFLLKTQRVTWAREARAVALLPPIVYSPARGAVTSVRTIADPPRIVEQHDAGKR